MPKPQPRVSFGMVDAIGQAREVATSAQTLVANCPRGAALLSSGARLLEVVIAREFDRLA